MAITAEQCRMARAALNLGVRELAASADVAPNTIVRLERGDPLHRRTRDFIQGYFEAEGVTFIGARSVVAPSGSGVALGSDLAKSSYAKLFEDFWGLPDLRLKPEQAYSALLDLLTRYLDIIDAEGREPDVWERDRLNHMLTALSRCQLFAAYWDMRTGVTPPDNQSPEYPPSAETVKFVTDLDMKYFRRCIDQLTARGYSATAV